MSPLPRLENARRWWNNWRGDWRFVTTKHLRVLGTFNAWAINLPRPYFHTDGDGEGHALYLFGIRWGNGNSDPVWSLDFEVTGR